MKNRTKNSSLGIYNKDIFEGIWVGEARVAALVPRQNAEIGGGDKLNGFRDRALSLVSKAWFLHLVVWTMQINCCRAGRFAIQRILLWGGGWIWRSCSHMILWDSVAGPSFWLRNLSSQALKKNSFKMLSLTCFLLSLSHEQPERFTGSWFKALALVTIVTTQFHGAEKQVAL